MAERSRRRTFFAATSDPKKLDFIVIALLGENQRGKSFLNI